MGIPSFYRWLVDRYPRCVVDAVEDSAPSTNGAPNPNGIEFDNLYLDMNGIIHPCFHPQDAAPPKDYDQVFQRVFMYIDRLFSVIRPRSLLFMAIDGVAPRAKMNHQRARRFRAAKESAESETHGKEENETLDSNVITPGTEFMELLSASLQYYIHLRMNTDPAWKGIKVILSDASVPGEGEHKIVSYIRLQRNLPGYDPNTRHCLYGLDADLIMLALATHEVHFTVLREVVRKSMAVDQSKHKRSGNRNPQQSERTVIEFDIYLSKQEFQLVRIWVLRDYLAHELQIPDPNVNTDFERLIDDFVFMCIFVGNDFLPHIPSLEIGEGAIDLLMKTYKKEFVHMGGYLTMTSEVNLDHVGHFVKAIGEYEMPIFRKRNLISVAIGQRNEKSHHSSAKHGSQAQKGQHFKVEDISTTDKVKFAEDGYRERYYALKFEVQSGERREFIRKHAVNKYIEGICWVMRYYYQGICSWNWFYPYHYAPFASDFRDIGQLEISFDPGRPFKPFDQLMGVLPAASAHALPFAYRQLMTHPSSPILDFYPKDFEVDLNGKRHSWQGVCKLPFIDESRLLAEISKVEHTLADPEVRRNSFGQDVLFFYQAHPLATLILSLREDLKNNLNSPESAARKEINPVLSGGMNGYMYIPEKAVCPADIDSSINGLETIKESNVISVFYEVPFSHPHISKLPDGLIMPAKFISKDDVHPPALLWHESTSVMGTRCSQRPKPSNCISGSCLAKMAHRLVSENSRSENLEVLSEMFQRWLNRKQGEDVKSRVKTMVQICQGKSVWPEDGEIGKRKRVCRDESLENHKKVKLIRDSGELNNNKIVSQCNGETNKIQSALDNHGECDKRETYGAGKLSARQQRRLKNKKNKLNARNNDEMSTGRPSVQNHDEINIHSASESNGQKNQCKIPSEGYVDMIIQSDFTNGITGKRKRDCRVESLENQKKVKSSRDSAEMTNDKIASQCNCETNKIQSAIENHGECDKRAIDEAGKLSEGQKRRLRKKRSKLNPRNNDERATDEAGKLSECQKRKLRRKISKMNASNYDKTSKVQSSLENYSETKNAPFASESNGETTNAILA